MAHTKAQTLALLEGDKGSNWRQWWTRLQPIRTAAELTARIIIEPEIRIPVYQKLSDKAKQLHLLGMSFPAIAKSLGIDAKTALKAYQNALLLNKQD